FSPHCLYLLPSLLLICRQPRYKVFPYTTLFRSHEVIDKELRRSINLHSGGKGYLFQRGKVQEVEWKNQDGNIVPMIDGEVVPFEIGRAHVNVVQTEPEKGVKEQVHYSNDGK